MAIWVSQDFFLVRNARLYSGEALLDKKLIPHIANGSRDCVGLSGAIPRHQRLLWKRHLQGSILSHLAIAVIQHIRLVNSIVGIFLRIPFHLYSLSSIDMTLYFPDASLKNTTTEKKSASLLISLGIFLGDFLGRHCLILTVIVAQVCAFHDRNTRLPSSSSR